MCFQTCLGDAGRCSSLIMLDYSQAFDSISHSLLLAKLRHIGFHENAIVWFRSYLENRLQVTKVDTDISPPLEKLRGVPQGSFLGTILFTLYSADLSSCVSHCKAHAYADDCQLHFSYEFDSIDQVFAGVNSDLERLDDWSQKHGLKLNAEKCMVLHIASPTICQKILLGDTHIKLGDKELTVKDTVKTLGVVLDRGLTFLDHITHVSQLALGRLRGLYRYRSILPEFAKLQLVQSLVLSVLYYCFPAFGNSITGEEMSRVQRLQCASSTIFVDRST
uniref:Reverse transcriptase domain-containing protein n=1 Tax=Graphocephala atropunctata TaxID=36148 RepID=A0A1B6LAL7_9HEMI